MIDSKDLSEQLEQPFSSLAADLWMEDCPPCKLMSPKVERVAEEQEDRIELAQVRVEEGDGLLGRFEVEVIPTLLFYDADYRGRADPITRELPAALLLPLP